MPNHHTKYPRTAEQRFWSYVDPCRTDGCMVWVGYCTPKGYGRFGSNAMRAHHFLVGKPPEGMVWDHVKERGCTHRNCVSPEHLELVTHRVNTLRGEGVTSRNATKTHCKYGHPFDAANTVRVKLGRECLTCGRLRKREWARSRRAGLRR